MVQLCEKTYLLSQAQVRYILRQALQSFLLAENFAAKTCNTRQEEKEHNAKGTENETILGSEVPAGYQKRHMAAGGSSTKGAVHTLWPYLPKALASGSFPIEVAGGRGFQREGFPRSQLRHLAQKESGMRTAGYRVALLLATVVVSGSALPASGRRRQRSDLSGAHGPGNS
jgi:hypothetical protein